MLYSKLSKFVLLSFVMILSAAVVGFHTTARATTSPSSGTIDQSHLSVSWTGGPPVPNPSIGLATSFDPATCQTAQYCDLFTLNLNIPSNLAQTNPQYYVNVSMTWTSTSDDYDMYVYNSTGQLVGSGTLGAGTAFEIIILRNAPSGTYSIYGDNWEVKPGDPYSANAVLNYQYPPYSFATRSANYVVDSAGKFAGTPYKFTPDQLLVGALGGKCLPQSLLCPQDVEPSIHMDQFGTIYASAIEGSPGGTDFWRSTDNGNTFTYLGQPDGAQNPTVNRQGLGGVGGGDDDIAIGTPTVVNGPNGQLVSVPGRVYLSSLFYDGLSSTFPESVTVANSINQGNNWVLSEAPVPLADRQWSTATGPSTYYLSYNAIAASLAGQTNLVFFQSTDGGLTFTRGTFMGKALASDISVFQGPIRQGPDGSIYDSYIGPGVNQIMLVKCTAPCNLPALPLTAASAISNGVVVKQAFRGPSNMTVANVFPQVAVDRAGNIYVSFSDGRNVYLIGSSNGGNSWTLPVKVNSVNGTALEPWMEAGDNGRVSIMWYGTDTIGHGPNDFAAYTNAKWKVYYTVTPNALASKPTFYEVVASGGPDVRDGVVHKGAICTGGTSCPAGTRNLAEYSSFTLDSKGLANIAYSQDANTTSTTALTEYTRELAGPSTHNPPVCQESDGDGEFQGTQHGDFHFSNDNCIDGERDHVDSNNRGDGKDFHSSEIQRAEYDNNAHTLTITGVGASNGMPVAFTFIVLETGLGAPGWVSYAFSDGYTNAGPLTSGSIILH